jgi:serine/threonine protein kinase
MVWLAKNDKNEIVALKQFPKGKANHQVDSTAKVEVNFGRSLFPLSDSGKIHNGLESNEFPGIDSIAKLLDDIEEAKDYWLVYEVGSSCLSKHLYDVKGEFYKGERIYHVHHQPLFYHMKSDHNVLRQFIRKIAEVYTVLSEFKIVHADIKPDNILVSYNGKEITEIKLIDFGSAFSYENPSNIQASTPEYLAPEVLEYLE